MIDIMVKEEDAPRINRIVERFQFATVTEAAQIKTEIEKLRDQKAKTVGKEATGMKKSGKSQDVPERTGREKSDTDQLMEELMGAPSKKEETQPRNPSLAKTEKSLLSEPISERHSRTAEGTAKSPEERPSVCEELREIRESRQKEAAKSSISEPTPSKEPKKHPATTHKQPSRKKTKKAKERCPMSNFDEIFESAPQTDEFDKEAWAAKKKAERDELYALADATAEAVCADGG